MYGMGFGWLFLLLLILATLYFLNENKRDGESARDILDKKYANDEITEEEYKTRKENLEK
ncbi:MAG: putative membrane protein [Sulfurimonas sp.]|jgi:putative membrane protein|uniref:hypothetical protein n=1 Tax=Sulfurimonas sp. TaxID=2022749 RepID=UPI0039E4BEC5